MDAPVGWSCERGAVGRYGGVGRLAAAWEVTVGVTSVGDAGVHRGLSPTAATRDDAGHFAAPGVPARSPEASRATRTTSCPRSPRGRCTAGPSAWKIRPQGDLRVEPPTREPAPSGRTSPLWVSFLCHSVVTCFCPQPGFLSAGLSLHFERLELTVSGPCRFLCLHLTSVFLDTASAPQTVLWVRTRMSHWLLGHLCVFSLCQCRVLVSLSPNWVCLGRAGPAWTSEPWKVTHDPVKLARLGATQWPDHSLASVLTGVTRSSWPSDWPISGFRQLVDPELLFHVFCTALHRYLLFPGTQMAVTNCCSLTRPAYLYSGRTRLTSAFETLSTVAEFLGTA